MSRFANLEFGGQSEHHSSQRQVRDESVCVDEARSAFVRGDFESALRAYARALEYNPRSVAAWAGQVRMLIELGELQEARLWADKALEQFPNEAELLAGKAVALARSGDLQAALAFSDAAIEEKGSTPYVWLARGDVLLAREEKRAEYCFEQALAAAPGDWTWGWLASRIHYYYKKFSLALRYASQALGVDAAHAVLWLQLGTCQAALGLTAAAYGSFEQARELDPKNADVSAAIAQLRDLTLTDRLVGQFRRWLA